MFERRAVDSWQQVESWQDFTAYLYHLAEDFDRAQAAADGSWLHEGIDSFLWGWVALLGGRIEGEDLLHEEAPGRPGWQGLAYQLHAVRTTPAERDDELAARRLNDERVPTVADFRAYVAALALDFAADERERLAKISRGEWAHDGNGWAYHVLSDWLDVWGRWITDWSRGHDDLEPVTWQSVAFQLSAAQVYE